MGTFIEPRSEEERIQRIGGILAAGVARVLLREQRASAIAASNEDGSKPELSDELAEMFEFVAKVRVVSPAEIRAKFRLSRTTAYRRLKALEDKGLIARKGNSRGSSYVLVGS